MHVINLVRYALINLDFQIRDEAAEHGNNARGQLLAKGVQPLVLSEADLE